MFRYLKNVDVKNNLSCDLPHVHLFDIVSFVYTLILMHIISLFLYSIVAVCVICFSLLFVCRSSGGRSRHGGRYFPGASFKSVESRTHCAIIPHNMIQ